MLRLLERWPTQTELATASRDELVAFARAGRHGWPERFADRVATALATPSLPVRDYLVRAKAAGIRLAAVQLLALHDTRRGWERRMGELLLGGPRIGRDHTAKDPDPPNAFPGGEIYLSFPAWETASQLGSPARSVNTISQFDTPNALQCYAGRAPVTRRSGKNEYVAARRLAHNRYLGDAVHQWAFCSLNRSAWAREFYDTKIAAGKSHHNALRALGNRWLEILWHCLTRGTPYNENHPHRQPQPRPRTRRLSRWLTEGVSQPLRHGDPARVRRRAGQVAGRRRRRLRSGRRRRSRPA